MLTTFLNGGFQFVPFEGGTDYNSGYYWSSDTSGFFNSSGNNNFGLLGGVGSGIGFIKGNSCNFKGLFTNYNIQTPFGGITIYYSNGKFMGIGFNFGLGIGYATTNTTTVLY